MSDLEEMKDPQIARWVIEQIRDGNEQALTSNLKILNNKPGYFLSGVILSGEQNRQGNNFSGLH